MTMNIRESKSKWVAQNICLQVPYRARLQCWDSRRRGGIKDLAETGEFWAKIDRKNATNYMGDERRVKRKKTATLAIRYLRCMPT